MPRSSPEGIPVAATHGSVIALPTIITQASTDHGPISFADRDEKSVVPANMNAAPRPPRTAIMRLASHGWNNSI